MSELSMDELSSTEVILASGCKQATKQKKGDTNTGTNEKEWVFEQTIQCKQFEYEIRATSASNIFSWSSQRVLAFLRQAPKGRN